MRDRLAGKITPKGVTLNMIETERLNFRPITWDDIDWLYEMRLDPEVSRYLGGVPTREKLEARTRFHIDCHEKLGIGMCLMTYKPDDKMIGFAGLQPLEAAGEIEVGYSIVKDHWGLGIGTEACRGWLRFGFNKYGLERIIAVAHPDNLGSTHIMEKNGMKYEKNIFAYEADCVMYGISKDEFNALNKS
jgi:ribosomal-protein-alanine N-acetyltransferase